MHLDGAFAGHLRQDGSGRASFAYDEAYAAADDPTPLSFVIGLGVRSHKPSHVRNWFDGLLPDNATVREEWARDHQVSARNPIALLRHVGRDAAGAVQVVPAAEGSDDVASRTGDVRWLDDGEVESLLNGLRTHRADWGREVWTGRWSLAGAQNKVALHRDGGRWGVPLDATPTTHILKTSISGFDLHDVNELACQQAARRLGLPAATTSLLSIGEERAVVSTRFDRLRTDDGWRRVHQEDLCQALGAAPTSKYQSDGGPGVPAVATLFSRLRTHEARTTARRRFFDYLAFNVVIGNTDAHAKNFAVLHAGSTSALAPLYDVASWLPYLTAPIASAGLRTEAPRSALKIGSTYDLPSISEADVARCARTLSLDPEEGVERYRELAARAPGALEDVAATLDDAAHGRFVRDLAAAVSAHVDRRWRGGRLVGP